MAADRISSIASHLSNALSSNKSKKWDDLPNFDELPNFHEYTGCAWGVWGEGDELGTINLLTEDVVREAAKLPLFSRRPPHIELIKRVPTSTSNDDEITINSQSGSQWDGLRHFGIAVHGVFYQKSVCIQGILVMTGLSILTSTPTQFFKQGKVPNSDPLKVDPKLIKFGIHNWAQHGISGRAVFLDMVRFLTKDGEPLPYDPWMSHAITAPEIEACARAQGVTFQKADILLLRVGFTKRYYESSQAEKEALANKPETFAGIEQSEEMKRFLCAGIEQSEEMKRFLWNNHFAAIASDQPALERWPPVEGKPHMHSTIIGLWGELFDLEKLSELGRMCKSAECSGLFLTWRG
ncbi:hypothetical protein A7U60_g3112 [Sanghuangporus baumii]|uniref:Uncharacterized protein n=1 Tax=Sanghuangporus baumii TaxID=108892 RepID=A0A9Q5I0W1_SANBA|nr:hypothetical protein A7U60_g3112 [Sanghuangporus baumii]